MALHSSSSTADPLAPVARPAAPAARLREVAAAVLAAVITLATVLTLGLLAYAPIGALAGTAGLPAAFVAVAAGGSMVALLGRSRLPVAGPSSATALIFAAAVAELVADPALRLDQPGHLVALLAASAAAVLAMGLWQLLFGLLRLGSLASFVPQPVLSGFMNGVALLILGAQLPMLLGVAVTATMPWAEMLRQAQPLAPVIGLFTAAVVLAVAWRRPRAPAALLGLMAGWGLDAALRAAQPGLPVGLLVGAVPPGLPAPDALLPLLQPDSLAAALVVRHAGSLLVTGLLLALIGSLETTLNARATDQDLQAHHDPDRELMAFGAGNVVSALFAGLPLVYWRARSVVLLRLGAPTRAGALACAAATGGLLLAAGPLMARLPLAVLAGVMLTVAIALMDSWTRRLLLQGLAGDRTRELWLNLAVVSIVCAVTLWRGFVAGVAIGVLLAMLIFVVALNRSLVRGQFSGTARPSRRMYVPALEALLAPARRQIVLIELEGALFFGNAERLPAQLDRLEPGCRFLVLDLRRITTIDATGAMALSQLSQRCAQRGMRLMLAGLAPEHRHGRSLRALSSQQRDRRLRRAGWYADSDRAIEAAERQLLKELGASPPGSELPLAQTALMQGLDPQQHERLCSVMTRHELAPGERLFRQGDAADRLFVLTRGSITVVSSGLVQSQRLLSLSPGMMFGETAMLDGGGRTADAVADEAACVYALTQLALDRLHAEEPQACSQVYRNVARHLSERLRHANEHLRSLV
jgi:SulP family sulfate permease